MRRMLHALALLLGLTLLAADPASAAWSAGQKVASGSAAVVELLASENLPLSAERTGEKSLLAYDLASDSPVAARGATGVGKHAGESIAARSAARDFTAAERAEINRIGSKTGCHTCGTTNPGTKSGNFVPDHQPPNALNPTGGPQRLYPQCISCSRDQGLEIARQLSHGAK